MLDSLKKPFKNIQERINRISENTKSIAFMLKSLIHDKKKDFSKIFNKKEDFLLLLSGGIFKLLFFFINDIRKYEIHFNIIFLIIVFLMVYYKNRNLNSISIIVLKILMGIFIMGFIIKLFILTSPVTMALIDFCKEVLYESKKEFF